MTMQRYAILAGLGLVMAGCGPVPGGSSWTGVPPLNSANYVVHNPDVIGLSGAETLPEAAIVVQRRFGIEGRAEGNYRESVRSQVSEARGVVVMNQTRLPDDSVRDVQHVVEFDLRPDPRQPDRLRAVASGYGTRQTCWRAADPEAWTNQPCP